MKTIEFIHKPIRRIITISKLGKKQRYFLSFPKLKFEINGYFDPFGEYCLGALRLSCLVRNKYRFLPFLPNVFDDGLVCVNFYVKHNNKKSFIADIVKSFWLSEFNLEESYSFYYWLENRNLNVDDYFRVWEVKTKEDPSWVPGRKFLCVATLKQ